MDLEVNGVFSKNAASSSGIGGVHGKAIVEHNWITGGLKTKVKWSTKQPSWEAISDLKEDYLLAVLTVL
jgi:hypothetical protein